MYVCACAHKCVCVRIRTVLFCWGHNSWAAMLFSSAFVFIWGPLVPPRSYRLSFLFWMCLPLATAPPTLLWLINQIIEVHWNCVFKKKMWRRGANVLRDSARVGGVHWVKYLSFCTWNACQWFWQLKACWFPGSCLGFGRLKFPNNWPSNMGGVVILSQEKSHSKLIVSTELCLET